MPYDLYSVSALVCEKVLLEGDGIFSAIRLVDIFYVADPPSNLPEEMNVKPLVQPHILIHIKSHPHDESEHSLEVKLKRINGEILPVTKPTKFSLKGREPSAPGGATVAVAMNLDVENYGTCEVLVFLDGEQIAKAPITVLKQSKLLDSSPSPSEIAPDQK